MSLEVSWRSWKMMDHGVDKVEQFLSSYSHRKALETISFICLEGIFYRKVSFRD